MKMRINVYEPNKVFKLGLNVWPVMVSELWEARELVVRLFIRNLSARHKQSLLGIAWSFIVPFVAIGTFVLLKRAGILAIGDTNVPYPLFALLGLTLWQFFAGGISLGCNALIEAGDMIAKVKFPREVLVLASLAQAFFELLIKLGLIAAVCVYYGFLPPWTAVLAIMALVPLVFLTTALALLLSLANAVFRDVAQVVMFVTTFWMFLTPVLYPPSGKSAWLFALNPMTIFIQVPRDLFLYGKTADPLGFMAASLGAFILFLCAWRVFYLVETKIPERL